MTPRSYNLGKRVALKEQTRHRIVEATFKLHSEKGVVATSMQDIADRADVALHTLMRSIFRESILRRPIILPPWTVNQMFSSAASNISVCGSRAASSGIMISSISFVAGS